MKAKELIQKLSHCDPDDIVIMSRDGEGNGFSPLSDVETNNVYIADSTWSGEIKLKELTPELKKQGYDVEDTDESGQGVPCTVLWPTN